LGFRAGSGQEIAAICKYIFPRCNLPQPQHELIRSAEVIAAEPQYRDWMVAALGGDATAYRRLLAALTRHLRAYYVRRVGSATAEDLVQETLIAIHSRRATYDPGQPLTAWVYGIARYKMIDEFRRERRRASVPLEDAEELFAIDESEALSARRDVEKLLHRLPEAKRFLVRAVKLDGSSIAEVAAQTGLSEAAVKVGVHRAVKSLADDIGRDRAN
jgi:RNA polymerase sigma-70 factor (ECF subfamily)